MKKNDEGYVLAMVMAVIAVLAVVASAMLGVGLRNVQTQQAAVVRMQAKYEAEGMIEKIVAELNDQGEVTATSNDLAKSNLKTKLDAVCQKYIENEPLKISIDDQSENEEQTFKYEIISKNDMITVKCLTELECEIKQKAESVNEITATVGSAKYISYEIFTTTEGGATE